MIAMAILLAEFETMLWPIVRSAGELLASDNLPFVRACSSKTCQWFFSRYQQEPPPPLVQYEAVRQPRESAEVLCPGARKVKVVVRGLFETEARLRRNHQSSLIIDSHFEEKNKWSEHV